MEADRTRRLGRTVIASALAAALLSGAGLLAFYYVAHPPAYLAPSQW